MKRLSLATLCTALVLAVGTTSLNAVQPIRPPLPRPGAPVRMLFISNQGSTHFRLYSMRLDGSDVRQIPNWTDYDNWPSYSPDGSTIVFASYRTGTWHIFAMNADGSKVRQLTKGRNQETEPVYSPLGNVLAFTCAGPGWQDICLASPNGTGMVKLTDGQALYRSPTFSPWGSMMAFVGVPLPTSPSPSRLPDIYVLTLGKLAPTKITDGSVSRYAPVFTPDEKHIVYDQDAYGQECGGAGLFVMGLDGSNQLALTANAGMPAEEPGVIGNKVVFTTGDVNGNWNIYTMNLDGSQVQRLTTNGATNLRYLSMTDY